MTLNDLLNQGKANNPGGLSMPSYAAGSLGDTYMKGLMADPTFQANLTAYNDKSNWSGPTDADGNPTSGPAQYHNPAAGNMPSNLVNIPGVGWINPNTNDPLGQLRGGNVWSSPDQTAGNSYHAMGFGQNGNLTSNDLRSTEKNMSFGQTMLHDVLPLAAFVLGGGALAGGFAGAGAAAGGAAEAGAGSAAGYTGADFGGALSGGAGAGGSAIGGGSLGLGSSGAFGAGTAAGYTGADFGGALSGGAGAGGAGASGSIADVGAAGSGSSGSFGNLGSGFNGLGINSSTFANAGDMSSFGNLAPSAGGVNSSQFAGGIGSGAGDGLGSTLGSGFNGTDINGAIDTGTAQGNSGLRGLYNQAKGIYNGPVGQTYRGISSLYDLYAANQKAKNAKDQMDQIKNLYTPDSLYAQNMSRQLNAADAAAGRNSQYGARAVQLAQGLASAQGQALMSPAYQGLNSTYNTNKYGGLTSLSKLFGAGSAATAAVPALGTAASSATSGIGDWLSNLF